MTRPIAVLGSGSWGTALAIQLARAGRDTVMWGIETHEIEAMAAARRNKTYLPNAPFPDRLAVTTDLDVALADAIEIFAAHIERIFAKRSRDVIHDAFDAEHSLRTAEAPERRVRHRVRLATV